MTRAAAVRVGASAFSWILFAFCFTLLLLMAASIVGLGGTSCASGGPFDVRTPCSDASWLIMVPLPLAIGAITIGAYLGGGFGTPLTTWAFPLTFIGYGIAFFVAAFAAGIGWVFIICGALFVLMGTIWLVVVLRGNPRRAVLGSVNVRGRRFVAGPRARSGFFRAVTADREASEPSSTGHGAAIRPTARDWMLSLGIVIVFASLGVSFALLLFAAVEGHG